MEKCNRHFSTLLNLYIITAFIGANIAIGFIAISHIICFALLLLNFLKSQTYNHSDHRIYNYLLYLIIFIIMFISFSIFWNIKESEIIINSLKKLKYLLVFLVLIYTIDKFKPKIDIEILSKILIGFSLIVCVYGIYQSFTSTFRIGSFAGVMDGPHNISIITLVLLALIYLKKIKLTHLPITMLIISGNLIVLYNSQTRGAWIAFIAGAFTLLLLSKYKMIWKLLIVIASVLLIFYNLDVLKKELIDDRSGSNTTRYALVSFGIDVMTENPITGIGYKQFGKYFQENHSRFGINQYSPSWADHAHNTYIQIGATAGIPALVFILCFFFFWIKLNFRNQENKIIFIPAIISIILSGLTHNNLGIAQSITLITLLFAINIVSIKMESFRRITPQKALGT